MSKDEFIKWVDEVSSFEKECEYYYRDLVDYANYDYNYLSVEDDYVEFIYEEKYWGGSSMIKDKYSFNDFINAYNNDSLK